MEEGDQCSWMAEYWHRVRTAHRCSVSCSDRPELTPFGVSLLRSAGIVAPFPCQKPATGTCCRVGASANARTDTSLPCCGAVPAFLAEEADNRDPLLGPDRVMVERV